MDSTLAEHAPELVSILGVMFVILLGLVGLIYKNQNKKIEDLTIAVNNIAITKFLTQEELDEHCKSYREICPKGNTIEAFGVELKTISENVRSIKNGIDRIVEKQEIMREKTIPDLEKNISREYLSLDRFDKYFEDLKNIIKETKGKN